MLRKAWMRGTRCGRIGESRMTALDAQLRKNREWFSEGGAHERF